MRTTSNRNDSPLNETEKSIVFNDDFTSENINV